MNRLLVMLSIIALILVGCHKGSKPPITPSEKAKKKIQVDIDYFKVYNDTLGHPAGDKLLKKFSRILMNSVRKVDYFGRIGGEEFLIILPETNLKDGAKLVDRIRETVADTEFYGESKLPHKKVTISVGIAEFIVGGKIKRKDLIDRADERLYKAKHAGRNVVVSK